MKASNKELLLDVLRDYETDFSNTKEGVCTNALSEKLGIQRANISSILNQLVKEGDVEKSNGRPVLYRLKRNYQKNEEHTDVFQDLIGYDGSLHNAVQLAKAAILYPSQHLNSLIIGSFGTGKNFFITLMRQFAVAQKIVHKDSVFVKFSIENYVDDVAHVAEKLFGTDNAMNLFEQAKDGILVLDHIELLPPSLRTQLFESMEAKQAQANCILICTCNEQANLNMETVERNFPVKIKLPQLNKRPLRERLALIQYFCGLEAIKTNRILHINSELLRCLLLYECSANIKQLHMDIKIGCANAYVREFVVDKSALNLFITDFPNNVRKGFLNYKKYRIEIEALIPKNHGYTFSEQNMEKNQIINVKSKIHRNMYDMIEEKIIRLRKQGLTESEINNMIGIDIEEEFYQYSRELSNQIVNVEQLKKIVDKDIIVMVTQFLQDSASKFHREYPLSCLYGLCLHMQSAIFKVGRKQQLSNRKVMDIIDKYTEEYAHCSAFAIAIEERFGIILPMEEVIFITMFISDEYQKAENINNPVILMAMHGDHTASAVVDVVNTLGKGGNIYAFDMDLNTEPMEAYEAFKDEICKIHRGSGILLIYDMGSFMTMANMVSNETGIKIRCFEVPITLLGLECSRRALMEPDLDKLADSIVQNYPNVRTPAPLIASQDPKKQVIITLCMSGEGGAIQLKSYIEKHANLKDVDVIALAMSEQALLQKEIAHIKENHRILCICGSYEPQVGDIPFISIADIFSCPSSKLASLLQQPSARESILKIDYASIYEYLQEQLVNVDITKLKSVLPPVIQNIKKLSTPLAMDQELGLFVHVACSISRLLQGEKLPVNLHASQIVSQNPILVKQLKEAVKALEEMFHIVFDDYELSTIIAIIETIRR